MIRRASRGRIASALVRSCSWSASDELKEIGKNVVQAQGAPGHEPWSFFGGSLLWLSDNGGGLTKGGADSGELPFFPRLRRRVEYWSSTPPPLATGGNA